MHEGQAGSPKFGGLFRISWVSSTHLVSLDIATGREPLAAQFPFTKITVILGDMGRAGCGELLGPLGRNWTLAKDKEVGFRQESSEWAKVNWAMARK